MIYRFHARRHRRPHSRTKTPPRRSIRRSAFVRKTTPDFLIDSLAQQSIFCDFVHRPFLLLLLRGDLSRRECPAIWRRLNAGKREGEREREKREHERERRIYRRREREREREERSVERDCFSASFLLLGVVLVVVVVRESNESHSRRFWDKGIRKSFARCTPQNAGLYVLCSLLIA